MSVLKEFYCNIARKETARGCSLDNISYPRDYKPSKTLTINLPKFDFPFHLITYSRHDFDIILSVHDELANFVLHV